VGCWAVIVFTANHPMVGARVARRQLRSAYMYHGRAVPCHAMPS